MSMIWRLQHHQWTDFTYPDGKMTKVFIVPMRCRRIEAQPKDKEPELPKTPYEIECEKAKTLWEKRTIPKRLIVRYLSAHPWGTVPVMAREFGTKSDQIQKTLCKHSNIVFVRDGKYGQQTIWKLKKEINDQPATNRQQ